VTILVRSCVLEISIVNNIYYLVYAIVKE
jgi:hypothetical protein